jgi:hypothetical protein
LCLVAGCGSVSVAPASKDAAAAGAGGGDAAPAIDTKDPTPVQDGAAGTGGVGSKGDARDAIVVDDVYGTVWSQCGSGVAPSGTQGFNSCKGPDGRPKMATAAGQVFAYCYDNCTRANGAPLAGCALGKPGPFTGTSDGAICVDSCDHCNQ